MQAHGEQHQQLRQEVEKLRNDREADRHQLSTLQDAMRPAKDERQKLQQHLEEAQDTNAAALEV